MIDVNGVEQITDAARCAYDLDRRAADQPFDDVVCAINLTPVAGNLKMSTLARCARYRTRH